MKNNSKTPLELYIHIPFCVRKCLYCDFLSSKADEETKNAYISALLKEIESVGKEAAAGGSYEVVSIFVGGGTPSILEAGAIRRILEHIRQHFTFSDNPEITIEANPGTLTPEKLRVYRESGINRLSLGLQSANPGELKTLGRIHTFEDFLESYHQAREAGFLNINVDLMFALPGQSRKSWETSLRTVAGLRPEHISAYSLILEPGTPFGEETPDDLPDEDTEYAMYDDTAAILAEYGYRQYEISNYAQPGKACRHNIGYWQGREYLGLGLGASSLYDGMRFSNTRELQKYLSNSVELDKIRQEVEVLTEEDSMEEFMFLGLRMTEGVSTAEFERRFGVPMEEIYGDVLLKYQSLGFMDEKNGSWFFTGKGIHVSNPILADFLFDTQEEE